MLCPAELLKEESLISDAMLEFPETKSSIEPMLFRFFLPTGLGFLTAFGFSTFRLFLFDCAAFAFIGCSLLTILPMLSDETVLFT